MEDVIAYIIIAFGIFGVFKFVRNVLSKGSQALSKRPKDSLPEVSDTRHFANNNYVSTRTTGDSFHHIPSDLQDDYELEYYNKRRVMGDVSAHDFVNLRKWEDELVADYQDFLSENENSVSKNFSDLVKMLGLIRGLIERSEGLFLDDLFNHLLPLLDKLFNNYVFFSQQDPNLIRGVTSGIGKAEEGIEEAVSLLRKKTQHLVDMEVVDMTEDIDSLECSHVDRLARKYGE